MDWFQDDTSDHGEDEGTSVSQFYLSLQGCYYLFLQVMGTSNGAGSGTLPVETGCGTSRFMISFILFSLLFLLFAGTPLARTAHRRMGIPRSRVLVGHGRRPDLVGAESLGNSSGVNNTTNNIDNSANSNNNKAEMPLSEARDHELHRRRLQGG